jgi:MarR family 2-MHQ and catechol resistance regulon transcriptional repressor
MKTTPASTRPSRRTTREGSPASPGEERALKLWVVMARAYGAVARHVEADVARHGLTGAEFGVLEALHHKGVLRLGEIQQKLLVTSGGITYHVDRLAAKGLVERRDCPEDRRVRYAALTAEGEALIRRIFPEHRKAVARALAGLGAAEQAQATALLRTLGLAASAPPEGEAA